MFSDLLSDEVQQFIRHHEEDDVNSLILKGGNVHGVSMSLISDQIASRKKAQIKLPTFYQRADIVYPPPGNLSQSSSEQTASFKSNYVLESISDKGTIVDLTGGFGVDAYFFSPIFRRVLFIEPNATLLNIARHNHERLGAHNIDYHETTAQQFLDTVEMPIVNCVYLDPSRRTKGNRKVFTFSDCEPDATQLITHIFEKTNYVLIKASPLLDIQAGIMGLNFVKRVFVISVQNECKEVLFLCDRSFMGEPAIEAINILKEQPIRPFIFQRVAEEEAVVKYSEPLAYLYEPNASLLKAGAFKTVAAQYNLAKIHPNTHLYTSSQAVLDFPGTIFRIVGNFKSGKRATDEFFPTGRANITTRNYPLTPDALKAKTKLRDGGDRFLIGFSGIQKKYLIVAEKVS